MYCAARLIRLSNASWISLLLCTFGNSAVIWTFCCNSESDVELANPACKLYIFAFDAAVAKLIYSSISINVALSNLFIILTVESKFYVSSWFNTNSGWDLVPSTQAGPV